MADHDFLFALELSDETPFDDLLKDLIQAVLAHVSFAPAAVDELSGALRTVLTKGAADGKRRCDVRFQARGGQLEVAIGFAGAAPWRTTRPLP
ncbi:MAG: hypothetical protein HY048_18000 [Acidobacteria bacterium]|nr:hypothetical protein [Acidobacteriota bacterium]